MVDTETHRMKKIVKSTSDVVILDKDVGCH